MTPNTKFHLQSILFAVTVFFFAALSSSKSQPVEVVQLPREAQLTATVVDATDSALPVEETKPELVQVEEDTVEPVVAYEAAALDNEPAPGTQTTAPDVVAAAFIAKEVGSEERLGEYQADYRWPIASITKLMTAVVALEKLGADTQVVISQEAVMTEGDSGGFFAGEIFTVSDLVSAMMTVSSNDAAAALADHIGTPRFFDLMQEKAFELKMTDSSFIDATGLSYLNQSTAHDVTTLITYVYENYPEILRPSKNKTNTITELGSGMARVLTNINMFAGTAGFVGGKTGFTDESKGNLVSLFEYDGNVYVFVVFGTGDRFAETRKLFSWLKTEVDKQDTDD